MTTHTLVVRLDTPDQLSDNEAMRRVAKLLNVGNAQGIAYNTFTVSLQATQPHGIPRDLHATMIDYGWEERADGKISHRSASPSAPGFKDWAAAIEGALAIASMMIGKDKV